MSVRKGGMIIAGSVADAQRVSNMEQVVSTATNKYPSSKAVNDLVPVGSMIIWGGPNAPAGRWIIANGAAISRTTYAELFAIYGTTWGAGDGNTTFNLPNAIGRYAFAETIGAYYDEQLPNITGEANRTHLHGLITTASEVSGAFKIGVAGKNPSSVNTSILNGANLEFNASLSSSVYTDGGKVIPKSFGVAYYVKY